MTAPMGEFVEVTTAAIEELTDLAESAATQLVALSAVVRRQGAASRYLFGALLKAGAFDRLGDDDRARLALELRYLAGTDPEPEL